MLKGKTVVLGVTGSIAAYKIASLASMLVKQHCDVHVIMTKNATNFINPIAFETLTNNKCLVDTFDRNFQFHVAHVSVAQKADVMMIAPASANIIAKLAHGIADDMLSTTALACSAKKIVSPAMNVHMFENPIVQDNLNILKKYDMEVVEPAVGYLACGDTGAGKMPEPEVLFEYILREIACEKDLKGKKVVINVFPSLDTAVCAASVRRFNKEAASLPNTVVLAVSKDLPFAQGRFCTTEGIDKVIPLSAFRCSCFENGYGMLMVDGPLKGLLARGVIVVDEAGKVVYEELVSEITNEPNYEAAIASLKN